MTKLDAGRPDVAEVAEGETFVVETVHHLFLYKEKLITVADLLSDYPKEMLNHLPVYIEGAGMALGDVHVAQSNGEGICPIYVNATVDTTGGRDPLWSRYSGGKD